LAYQGMSAEHPGSLDSVEARRSHVFDAYIEQMFSRRRSEHHYTRRQTVGWLAWLAEKMTQHSQNILLIEQLQPSWLPTRAWSWFYILVSRMIGGLLIGLIFGLSIGVIFGAEDGPGIGLFVGLLFGFSVGLSVGLVDIVRFARSSKGLLGGKSASRWQLVFNALPVGLVAGIIEGLVVFGITRDELAGKLSDALMFGTMGLVGGLIVGVFLALRGSRRSLASDIRTVDALSWSWEGCLRSGSWGLIAVLALGLILGLITAIPVGLSDGLRDALSSMLLVWLIGGLIAGPIGALVGAVFGGLSSRIVETKTAPNQGIRYSQRNAVFAGLILGPFVGMISSLILGLSSGLVLDLASLIFGTGSGLFEGGILGLAKGLVSWIGLWIKELLVLSLSGGLGVGLFAAMWYGGFDVVQHYTLRLILYSKHHIPWNLARFLDYATERIFLRKVGGGYIFIHRLLQDHFASLYQGQRKGSVQMTYRQM